MPWLFLSMAVFSEIAWALSLKWASTLGTWQAGAVPVGISFVTMGLLALAMRGLPAGTAYAIWTGLGAIGVIAGGVVFFGERVGPVQGGFMALTVVGIIGTKVFAAG